MDLSAFDQETGMSTTVLSRKDLGNGGYYCLCPEADNSYCGAGALLESTSPYCSSSTKSTERRAKKMKKTKHHFSLPPNQR